MTAACCRRAVIRDCPTDAAAARLVSYIIDAAHHMQLKVAAEGIETAVPRDFLTAAGGDYLQGFLLGRPMPAGEFAVRLAAPGMS